MTSHIPQGFILLARRLLESEVWLWDSEHLRLWLYLLLSSNMRESYTKDYGEGIVVGYGQTLKSMRQLALGASSYGSNNRTVIWSKSTVSRMLKRFEKAGMITTEFTKLGTMITIVNAQQYQSFDTYRANGLGTAKKRERHAPGPITTVSNTLEDSNHIDSLWSVWLDVLGGSPPHPKLTPKRKKILSALWQEQLKDAEDPEGLFRKVCEAIKNDDFISSTRAWQYPESTFKSAERRERWAHTALKPKASRLSDHQVSLEWTPEA